MPKQAIVIDAADNVATAVAAFRGGEEASFFAGEEERRRVLREDIPAGHKFALRDIAAGETVLKYGQSIGTASRAIAAGEHVHVHNVQSGRGRGDLPLGERS